MASKPFFLDSNGWVALRNSRDPLHPVADAMFQGMGQSGRSAVLTDWVLAETGNGLSRTPARKLLPEVVKRFLQNPQFSLVVVSPELRERALKLYADRSDKTWGLVDCASFIVMSELGITDAFTTDRHFEQARFNCLLPAAAV